MWKGGGGGGTRPRDDTGPREVGANPPLCEILSQLHRFLVKDLLHLLLCLVLKIGVATCRPFFSTKPGSGRTGNRAFISLPSDGLEPLIMEIPHRRPTATRSLSGKSDYG